MTSRVHLQCGSQDGRNFLSSHLSPASSTHVERLSKSLLHVTVNHLKHHGNGFGDHKPSKQNGKEQKSWEIKVRHTCSSLLSSEVCCGEQKERLRGCGLAKTSLQMTNQRQRTKTAVSWSSVETSDSSHL